MKITKILLLFALCKAPMAVFKKAITGMEIGRAEFATEEWEGFVKEPRECRSHLREIIAGMVGPKSVQSMELLFGASTVPKSAGPDEIVCVDLIMSGDVSVDFRTRRGNFLELNFPTEIGYIKFYITIKDPTKVEELLQLNKCSKTFLKDYLFACAGELTLKRIMFFRESDRKGCHILSPLSMMLSFDEAFLKFFESNGVVLTNKALSAFNFGSYVDIIYEIFLVKQLGYPTEALLRVDLRRESERDRTARILNILKLDPEEEDLVFPPEAEKANETLLDWALRKR